MPNPTWPFPSCHSQIVVSLVNGRPGAMNFSYSPLLRNFTKATNIRLRFLQTNTLLGHLMGKALRDPTVTRRVRQALILFAGEVELFEGCASHLWGEDALGVACGAFLCLAPPEAEGICCGWSWRLLGKTPTM